MMKFFSFAFVLFTVLAASPLLAQKTIVQGLVSDVTSGDPLPDATVKLESTATGTISDDNGVYSFEVPVPGTYNITCTYIGYEPVTRSIPIQSGMTYTLDFSMGMAQNVIDVITVEEKAVTRSSAGVVTLMIKSPAMLTGISRDDIRKAPNSNTSDVLKRLSGTSIQDNRYVVIRGLNDRYNVTLVNGYLVPSTEPDRRAFAFDLFPSSLLDQLIVYKTASAELPGEFAGGVVLLNTREIPEKNFFQISLGTTINSQTTGEQFLLGERGGTDWLGIDDGTRKLPALPSTTKYKAEENNPEKRDFNSKLFTDSDWSTQEVSASMRPAYSVQMSGAKNFNMLNEEKLAFLGSLSYSSTPKITLVPQRINVEPQFLNSVNVDTIYNLNNSVSALGNFSYAPSTKTRILFNNVINLNGENRLTKRSGNEVNDQRSNRNTQTSFIGNRMWNSQLRGEHRFTAGSLFKWGITATTINRSQPNMKTVTSLRNDDTPDAPFAIFVNSNTPKVDYASMFFSEQKDNTLGASADFKLPFAFLTPSDQNSVKVGLSVYRMARDFSARVFGYTTTSSASFEHPEVFQTGAEQLFTDSNIDAGYLAVEEATAPMDVYDGLQTMPSSFVMFDQHLTKKLWLNYGLRTESFRQRFNSTLFGGAPVNVDTTFFDVMPSANFTYTIDNNEKHRLRASASRTLSRPTLRELAPFVYFNFEEFVTYIGNPALIRSRINNFDVRYEFFPTKSQLFAIGGFYKKFFNPIEQVATSSSGNGRIVTFNNAAGATNSGAELEYRLRFFQAKETPFLKNFTLLGNFAYIVSEIDLGNIPGTVANTRPLQGQSPYVINSGLNYNSEKAGLDLTVSFNRIGRRIWQVGYEAIPDIYEAPRSVLDFNLTKKIMKNKAELRFSVQDVFNQPLNFYWDIDRSGAYEASTGQPGQDQLIQTLRFGSNYNVQLTWNF
jgi:TonB-dependent receptor